MSLLGKIRRTLSIKRRIAAIVDAVIDRLNDRYKLRVMVVEGGFEVDIVDKKPRDEINLQES